ncbi:MAG TPA: FKBP-type peptidyl-prolyl cis-trans isomerase [Opitutaceae bacterium]|nr:FKBP-type peptidyl-prolyl cis-trans isomerase [Opitutaceae bacterium]
MTAKRSAVTTWLLIASLTANAVLLGLVVRLSQKQTLPASVSTAALPKAAPATAANPDGAPLPFNLTPYAALGTFVSENNHIPALKWTKEQFDAFQRGLRASYEGRGYPVDEEATKLRDEISAKVQAMIDAKKTDPIADYFKLLREREGVKSTASGLHYRITQEGSGEKPTTDSTVLVSYTARLPNGENVPALSRARVRSAVSDLLPGMAEGVQMLTPGGKALLYLPPELSFGSGEWPQAVPKGAPIIFFLELHEVTQ